MPAPFVDKSTETERASSRAEGFAFGACPVALAVGELPAASSSAKGASVCGTASAGHSWIHAAIAAGLLLPLSGAAQLAPGHRSDSASFSISITVRPQFRILESRPVEGGHEYRVWTNMKSVQLNGQDYRFERVGEAVVVVPGERIEPPLTQQPSARTPAQQGG